jgi:DNA polymerase-3 subunit gamma/tau
MRDAISLLDQLTAYGSDTITLAQVQGLLGAASTQIVGELVARLAEKNISQGLALIANAVDNGADPRQLAREIVEYLRGLLLINSGSSDALTLTSETQAEMAQRAGQFSADQLVRAIRLFNQAAFELRTSAHPTLPLEIALVETTIEEPVTPRSSVPPAAPPPRRTASPPANPKPETRAAPSVKSAPYHSASNVNVVPPTVTEIAPETDAVRAPGTLSNPLTLEMVQGGWANVLARVKQSNRNAEALLRGAEPIKVEEGVIVLGFHYQVHAERFEKEQKWREVIEKSLDQVFQRKCRVKCMLSPERAKRKAVEQDPLIRAAMNQGAQITEIHEGA